MIKLKSMLEILQEYPKAYFRNGHCNRIELVLNKYVMVCSDLFPWLGGTFTYEEQEMFGAEIPYEIIKNEEGS